MRLSSYLLLAALLFTSGCTLLPEQIDETTDWSASQLYSKAKQELSQQNYEKAIDYFEKLEARYPFGRYAQQAQLEIAYAYYKYEEPDLAIAAADRFIKIYPRHPNIDYAWYIKGLTNYSRGKTVIDRYLPQEPSERDTFTMRQSYDDFTELVRRYPNSGYTKDASQRIIYLRNNMAAYEVHVADYYMRRSAFVAAANRGKYVVENFQRTPAVEDALVIMVRAYRKLGVNDMADSAMRVLQLNYPDNAQAALLTDPRGYTAAKKAAGSWRPWTAWTPSRDTDAVISEQEPVFWKSSRPWEADSIESKTMDPEGTEDSEQESGFWERWRPWKADTMDTDDPEGSEQEPGFWDRWRPWKPASEDSDALPGAQ